MVRIKVHNPGNERTKNYRYYNFFWDSFTDFLKTKFNVEENRYFEKAHIERYKVDLQKGTVDDFLLLECEYVIENLENGEFVILSVSDDLGYATLREKDNPYLKKCLISQYAPPKIQSHIKDSIEKYVPWTYFQFSCHDLEIYREQRKEIGQTIDKMYFRGETRLNFRPIIKHIPFEYLENPMMVSVPTMYFSDVIRYTIGLSVGGAAELCYRDIEYMVMEIPFIRFKYQTVLDPPLIPNYHYISIPFDEDFPIHNDLKRDRLGGEIQANKIVERYKQVINDKELLKFVATNARKYYDDNLTIDKLIENTYKLTEIEDWLK
jgi:hypothetical protein